MLWGRLIECVILSNVDDIMVELYKVNRYAVLLDSFQELMFCPSFADIMVVYEVFIIYD